VAVSTEYSKAKQAFRIALGLRNADRLKVRDQNRWIQEVSGRVPPGTQLPEMLQPSAQLQMRYLEARVHFLAAGATESEILTIEREMASAAGI
jgi:hypothetical protein